MHRYNLIGQIFGRLTVLEDAGQYVVRASGNSGRLLKCRCECGNEVLVQTPKIVGGDTRSCGCLHLETARRTGTRNKRHGMTASLEWKTWQGMRERCNTRTGRNYPIYGATGIKVCDRWQTFENFFADMGPRPSSKHSIDRIDVDGNYEPDNCRWVTTYEQARNRRTTQTIAYQGLTLCISEWAIRLGCRRNTLYERIRRGWSVEQIMTTPIQEQDRMKVGAMVLTGRAS